MITSKQFLDHLNARRVRFCAGVPCSYIKAAITALESDRRFVYVPAVKEDIALGICSGAYLSGANAAVIMQNSGLGHVINALTSFNLIYKIPVLMFVTWRGRGKDAPEHDIMGAKTVPLLKCIGIPHRVLSGDYKRDIDWAMRLMRQRRIPVALIVKEGLIK
ncbi:MAG TPA: thiamine pyrophosphate-binding protein [Candidatus Omnitrophota bacterium]|nr:thiamine pyrophosphate-binding protein [Candidatus Omnitrophota bacterium]